jgi:polysaccharide pyruvyl transferase WcaK-like protein
MHEANNEDWFEDRHHEEIDKANQMLMKDCNLLIGGRSHGALTAAIFSIPAIHMKSACKPLNIAKFWLGYSNSFSK